MSEKDKETGGRQLKIHTQYLVATTSVAKPLGWAPGDPIDLSVSRNGNIVIHNKQDPDTIMDRKVAYEAEEAAKEAEKQAKEEEKARKAAEKKAAKEAAEAEAEAEEEADEEPEESDDEEVVEED